MGNAAKCVPEMTSIGIVLGALTFIVMLTAPGVFLECPHFEELRLGGQKAGRHTVSGMKVSPVLIGQG